MRVRFDDYEIDTDAFELRRGGAPVTLEPQVFEVLADLVERAGQLVTKEDLLDRVWGDQFVSESALTSRIKSVRRALGDDGRQQRYIKTVHGRGYRFVGSLDGDTGDPSVAGRRAPVPHGPEHNLPIERTPLVGRERDLARVAALLERHRLVSLLGIGGVGKTRLAIGCGGMVTDRFADGVWFVDLVPAGSGHSVVRAMAEALDVALTGDATPTAFGALVADRRCLFVLDNCEHVVDDVAATLDHFLTTTSGPSFLVTSRVPLDLPDERRVRVDPLPAGDETDAGPAVRLFLAAAERFAVDADRLDVDLARSLCQQLDGLPLALELAAAQLRHLALEDLVVRLVHRFEILEAARRDGDRHAALSTILAETWERLEAEPSELLVQLAVFPTTFSLADVEEVADHVPPPHLGRLLATLVDLSLVDHLADRGRYRLLETVRLFAHQRAPSDIVDTARERHAAWCQRRTGAPGPVEFSDFQRARWAMTHADDLRQAEHHLRETERLDAAADLMTAQGLSFHLDVGTRAAHALERIQQLLTVVDDNIRVARLHQTGVMAAMAARAPEQLAHHGGAALAAAQRSERESLIAVALVLASWSTALVDPDRALAMVEEASNRAIAAGEPAAQDLADAYRAFHLANLRRWDEAIAQGEEVMGRTGREEPEYSHYSAAVAAAACSSLRDPDRALRAVDVIEAPPAGLAMWANQVLRAAIAASQGRAAETIAGIEDILAVLERRGLSGWPDVLVPIAILAHRRGEDERAARWLRAVRDADRSTQSFQVTFLFRLARDEIGLADTSPLADRGLDEIGAEARAWLTSLIDS